ncbi:ABC transporter substrate-binding protein [Acidilobus saccharovorans]|uniref:ABC transporter substrate-binding protein n=1 Tax=Acidilobus saccharovorans TaxID=242703 RepID=UPI001EE601F0|nr:ABC transporter substrate-binding protein [Acidilobus saccharovorans]
MRLKVLAIVVILVVVAALAASYVQHTRSQGSRTVLQLSPPAPSTYSAVAGQQLSLYIPSPAGYSAEVFLGNGSSVTVRGDYLTVSYRWPGRYLIYYALMKGGRVVASTSQELIEVLVTPNVSGRLSQEVSVPVIAVSGLNGTPVFDVGQRVSVFIGYLQPPSGQNMTIYKYFLSLGNGTTIEVSPRNYTAYLDTGNYTYLRPSEDPVNVSFSEPGLYPLTLTIETLNVSSGQTFNYSYTQTVAVESRGLRFSMFKLDVDLPNPGTIVVAKNVPGGPFSFDPDIDYGNIGFEVLLNVYSTLVEYFGANTTKFIPMAAEYIPTVGNWSNVTARHLYGAISPNYTVYVFKVRPGLRAANGDPITAYDVWYSVIRDMLCAGGTPGTPGWILTQYLIPNYTPFTFVVTSPNDTQGAEEIVNAITYDNATDTVTFHLVRPVGPVAFFDALADPQGGSILDAKWLEEVGDGINFTGLYDHNLTQLAEAFYSYEQTCSEGSYNTAVQWPSGPSAGFTGPYYIAVYTPGQSVVLKPNPYWPTNITYFPRPNDTVIIEWVKDPTTAYELFASGQADIVTNLPTSYIPRLLQLESQGKAVIYSFSPSLLEWFFAFNLQVNESLLSQLNPAYHIPGWYFANPLVREAFAYAFNYTEYIDDIVGNVKYHFNFGSLYCGALVPGLDIYIPPSELTGCPTFNLTYAKQLLEESGFYNVSVYFPIVISSGDTTDYTAAQMWAAALHNIDPNINAVPMYLPQAVIEAYQVPGQNGLPIYYWYWSADYPMADDFMNGMYLEAGDYALPDGWNATYLENLSAYFNQSRVSYPGLSPSVEPEIGRWLWQEAVEYINMNNTIGVANYYDIAGNYTGAYELYRQAEQEAMSLYMYVYTIYQNALMVTKPYMHGYMGMISWQENPMWGGIDDYAYFWWVKG